MTLPGASAAAARAAVIAMGVGLRRRSTSARAGPWSGSWPRWSLRRRWCCCDPGEIPRAARAAGLAVFGVFYVGGLIVPLPLLHRDSADGPPWVLLAIAVTFANDTGAYFVGRALGRHKLAPAISPGKTVEGAVGGLVAGIGFMFLARATVLAAWLTRRDCLLVGVCRPAVLGPVGRPGRVDASSGRRASRTRAACIPGHGGMLDRIDALLFVGRLRLRLRRLLR